MALVNVSENSGADFMQICKFDSRSGRIFRVDRGDGINTPVDITKTFKALVDFENVEIGYILFSAGGAPIFNMVPYGQPMPARPPGDFKSGVRLHIKLAPSCGGDVRELAGTANVFLRGINALHDEYLKLAPANPGKLPVVVLTDTVPIESGGGAKKSTNYMPQWAITGWAPRPADMPLQQAAAPQRQATNGTGAAPPPPVRQAPAAPPPPPPSDDFGD